jgi:hypothetical protein
MNTTTTVKGEVADPLIFAKTFWPEVQFYDRQKELMYSLKDNDETICVAGNMLGKDFTAGFLVLWFFLSRNPCRIVTTSVDATQLESVLWGEIKRFIDTSTHKDVPGVRGILNSTEGGPILVNHLHLRKIVDGKVCPISYVRGRVAAQGEGMLGHHVAQTGDGIPRTLMVADEASGVDDTSWEVSSSWANRKFAIGNPYPTTNFFYRGWKEGTTQSADKKTTYRKVVRIRAEDSPNVRLGLLQLRAGQQPTDEMLLPGVLSYKEYKKRRETWDHVKQTIGLDAMFYEGAEVLMYPPEWLDLAASNHWLYGGMRRYAMSAGIDPAEGGDKTSMCVVDDKGILDLVTKKTPDTQVIVDETIRMIKKWNLSPKAVCLDQGGGGKQIADQLRRMGYPVRTVAFGEAVSREDEGVKKDGEEIKDKEERYVYKNRRAQMYGIIRELIDPTQGKNFAIPAIYSNLRSELAPIPMIYDPEGRLMLPPKRKKSPTSKEKSLVDIIGHSPDEADALAIACYALRYKQERVIVGGFKSRTTNKGK